MLSDKTTLSVPHMLGERHQAGVAIRLNSRIALPNSPVNTNPAGLMRLVETAHLLCTQLCCNNPTKAAAAANFQDLLASSYSRMLQQLPGCKNIHHVPC